MKQLLIIAILSTCSALFAGRADVVRMSPVDKNYDIKSSKIMPPPSMAKTGNKPTYVEKGKLSKDKRIDFDKIVFIKRKPYLGSHYYSNTVDGIPKVKVDGKVVMKNGKPVYRDEETELCVLNLKTGEVKNLLPSFSKGTFENLDLSFDAKKIVFSWKEGGEGKTYAPYLLYEVNVDGTGLRQLTFKAENSDEIAKKYGEAQRTCDLDPCYLPDGSIVFSSTRQYAMTLCDPFNFLTCTELHKLTPDGKIERLTQSALSEFNPVMMQDGRIMYHRWEYVDKGNGNPKCLWSMRPDGSGTAEIYGDNIVAQRTFLRARQIPNNPDKILCLVTPHVRFFDIGTLVIIDTNKDKRSPEAMTFLTPYTDSPYHWAIRYFDVKQNKYRGFANGGKENAPERTADIAVYRDPYPLAENLFIVSHNEGRNVYTDASFGLYWLNDKGEHELIYRSDKLSAYNAMPLKPREVPPMISGSFDESLAEKNLAAVNVQDIYVGLKGVPRGTVKEIRIMEQAPRYIWMRDRTMKSNFRHSHIIPAPHLLSERFSHGVVPVEEDGSAHFYVPADKNIYLQLLDKNGMMIQTERTYINYKKGELRSCIGCHENSNDAPAGKSTQLPIALKRAPSVPAAQSNWDSPKRIFDYERQVQPIWDKYCVECHNGSGKQHPERFFEWGKGPFYVAPKKGEMLDLRGEPTRLFNVSYENLFQYVTWPNENEVTAAGEYAESYAFGSHRSALVDRLVKPCPNAKKVLTENEFRTVVDWLDVGALYYPSYWGIRGVSQKGKPNYRPAHTWESATREK